jgi:hypothetical protein
MSAVFDPYAQENWVYFTVTGESHEEDGRMEQMTFAAERHLVRQFLNRTVQQVPLGSEDYGPAVDRFLATLQ